MNAQSQYAFYGSLRRGMSNYLQFAPGLDFLFLDRIAGFQLYGMDNYPYAIRTHHPAHTITVEVFRVIDPEVENAINDLEISVGYYYDETPIRGVSTGIYLFKNKGSETLVNGGDWVKFFGA